MASRIGFRVVLLAVACLAAALTGALWPAPARAASRYPVVDSFAVGYPVGYAEPEGTPPPGANDWTCRPTAAHPYPVVLVHGTFEDMADNWQALSPLLADEGYCVFALDYGGAPGNRVQGTGPVEESARQLGAFVDRVLSTTGARKVDIVGHSQGGMMPRYYLEFLGGAAKVDTLVGLSPSNHGTTLDGMFSLAQRLFGPSAAASMSSWCPACAEQTAGSPFMAKLNRRGDTVPGVHYTVIETRDDEVVTPYTSAFLTGPHATNITLQDQCPTDASDHLTTPYDPVALRDVLNALSPSTAVAPTCSVVLPLAG